MKQILLKSWLMLCLLFVGIGTTWAEDPTVTLTTSSETSTSSVVVSPITFSFTNGSTNTSWYQDGLRFYEGATITVSSESNITKIVFTHGVGNNGCLNLTSGGGSYDASNKTWTGSSKSIVFTVGHSSGTKNGQVKLTEAVVSYSSGGGSTPTLYTVTLGDNSTSLTQTTEGGNVTLPAREGNSTYTFAGWSTTNNTEETTTAPTIISAGNYKPTANITLYPVYTRTDNGGSTDVSQTYETSVAPTGWTSNSITRTNGTGITSHGGSYWGSIAVNGTAYIQYNTALTGNVSVTAYVARTTGNTNKGEFKIQTKTSADSWTDRATLDVANSTVDEWQELSWTGTLNAEQVRVFYTGSTTAVRAIDDVCITYSTSTTYYISSIGEEKPTPTLSFANPTYNATMGEPFTAPTLTNSQNVTVSYSSSETGVATVNASTGEVSLVAAGTTTITASFAGNKDYNPVSASYELVVAEKFSYTIETVGSGTTVFKDGSDNVINPGDKVAKDTKIYPTFTPADGYEFTSWEYWGTSDGVEQWKTLNGDNFTITKNVKFLVTYTAIAPKAKYAVTIETPENGTLTIKDGETIINSGDEVEEGKTLTVEVEAADGYRFKNWGYKDGEANWVGNNTATFTHTMPSAPCSFKATFELIPTYTINWSVNGEIVKTDDLKEGAAVTAPETPDDINDKKFTGWVTTPTVEADATPSYVTPATAEKAVTYYAVFADGNGGGEATWTKVTDASTLAENDVIAIVSSEAVDYNIKGNTTKYNGYIAMSKTQNENNRAGVVVTVENDVLTINDNVQQITLTKATFEDKNSTNQTDWQLGVDGGYLYANSSSSNCLKTQATNDINGLWTISISEGKATIYAQYSSYTRNYIRVNGQYQNSTTAAPLVNAYKSDATTGVLASIYKKNGGASYSNFTTIPEVTFTAAGTINFVANDGEGNYYATFSSDKITAFPTEPSDEVTLYVEAVAVNGDGTITKYDFEDDYTSVNDDMDKVIIPANTGVLLHVFTTEDAAPSVNYEYTNAESEISEYDPELNMLVPCTTTGIYKAEADDNHYYKLAYGDNTNKTKLGFWYGAEDGSGNFKVKAGGAILCVPQSIGVKGFSFDEVEDATAIEEVEAANSNDAIYNIAGQRIKATHNATGLRRGLYIVNGKKVMVK